MSVDDEMIDRVLEGGASQAETEAFQAWLNVPENLERFALRAELHADLRRCLLRQDIQKSALGSNSGVASEDEDSLNVSPRRAVLRWSGLVAAACVLVAVCWRVSNRDSKLDRGYAASIVSSVEGWLVRDGALWADTEITVGDYELRRGLMSLRFGGGVMVYIEAPARFNAISDKRLVLHSGRLSARVPPEGIGFTVETPEAEVVDFGTEFSVDVVGGVSEVHVFDGLVRVNPGASHQRDALRSVDVQESQAVRISDGAVELENISIATDRFIRNFEEPRLNYARAVKRLSPLVYYRMPIRDRGLVSEPPEHSGIVLTGEGRRPPHACGVFAGGSLRVGADSTGRGGRADNPPSIGMGEFSLALFVYVETPASSGVAVTNIDGEFGNFSVSLDESGTLQGAVRTSNGKFSTVSGSSVLPPRTWRHVVLATNGQQLRYYEDGQLISVSPSAPLAASESDTIWFGTDARAEQVWAGRIDEVAFFDRTLTNEQVSQLYRTAQQQIKRAR